MRRIEREMLRDFGIYVIDHAQYGMMAIQDEPYPYSAPLSIARNEDTLYFHSAPSGMKYDENEELKFQRGWKLLKALYN